MAAFDVEVTLETGNGPDLNQRLNELAETYEERTDITGQSLGARLAVAHVDFSATVEALTVEAARERLHAVALCVLADAGENPSMWRILPPTADMACCQRYPRC